MTPNKPNDTELEKILESVYEQGFTVGQTDMGEDKNLLPEATQQVR